MKEINIGQATAITSPNPLVLVCTKKENGMLNMAPVSFFMYSSFNPPMLAFAMGKTANSGENIRKTGKAVLASPGVSLKDAVMAYGSKNGGQIDKLKEFPVALQNIDGTDIQIPEDSPIAFVASLAETVESGDHYLYLCNIDKIVADKTKEALFAWNGYAKVAPAQENNLMPSAGLSWFSVKALFFSKYQNLAMGMI